MTSKKKPEPTKVGASICNNVITMIGIQHDENIQKSIASLANAIAANAKAISANANAANSLAQAFSRRDIFLNAKGINLENVTG